jgi:hypothetical protein
MKGLGICHGLCHQWNWNYPILLPIGWPIKWVDIDNLRWRKSHLAMADAAPSTEALIGNDRTWPMLLGICVNIAFGWKSIIFATCQPVFFRHIRDCFYAPLRLGDNVEILLFPIGYFDHVLFSLYFLILAPIASGSYACWEPGCFRQRHKASLQKPPCKDTTAKHMYTSPVGMRTTYR